MNKATTKNKKVNLLVIEELRVRLGLSAYYIKQCVEGRRDGLTPDTIRKQYRELEQRIEAALEK